MPPVVVQSRRRFLRTTAWLAAAPAAGPLLEPLRAAQGPGWPIASRDAHLKPTGQPDCWAAMKFLGVTGVEAQVDDNLGCPGLYHPARKYSIARPEDRQALQADLAAQQLRITAFCLSNRLDERLEQEVEWCGKVAAAAREMGVKAIRIDVVPRKTPLEQFGGFAADACRRLCQPVEGSSVRFGIENHGRVTNDPEFLAKLFAEVKSPHLGLTMDFCNFYWWGHPLDRLYGIYERFASRVVHTHCKNIRYPEEQRQVQREIGWKYGTYTSPVFDGDIDYARVAGILRKAGYAGDLCLENECLAKFPAAEQGAVLKKEVAFLKDLGANGDRGAQPKA